jgi:hypothetical protein
VPLDLTLRLALLALAAAPAAPAAPPEPARRQPLAPQTDADDPGDFNAGAAEYNWATAGETFAQALAETCPRVLSGEIELGGVASQSAGLSLLPGQPSFLRDYPAATRWFSVDAAPRNVFLSLDAVPGEKRCRVVLANNLMSGAAQLWTGAALRRLGARVLFGNALSRRNLREEVWMIPRGEDALMFLVQVVPKPERGGRGWQGTGSVSVMSRAEARSLGVTF